MENNRKKIDSLETRLSVIRFIAIALCVVMVFVSPWLGENVLAYEVEETNMVTERYEQVVGTVSTYVCYTTEYGDKYHARGCGYLWNSSYKTTVYQAKTDGYGACSQCTPTEKTTLELKETRYREVEQTETITKKPTVWIWLISTGVIVLIYYMSTAGLKKRIHDLYGFEEDR